MQIRPFLFGIKYLATYWLSKNSQPLICGLVLHNACNLRCRHCTVVNRPVSKMSFEESTSVMDTFYGQGGRCLYLEGGEPLIWKSGEHTVEDVVQYAHKTGYYTVIIYTNGLQELETRADTIFVSIDGLYETHDNLRGESFERIIKNIKESTHPSLYINCTINSENRSEIAEFCAFFDSLPQVKGVFFYFHTPYYGYDELYLDQKEKEAVLVELLDLKKKHRILNSDSGLKSAIRNDWKRKLDICQVYEDGRYYNCCRENASEELCMECGYLSYAEIDQTLKLKPGAIRNALKYF